MPKRKSRPQPDKLSSQLLDALTEAEIAQLLDALFQVLPDDLQTRAIAQLDSDTQQIIQQILAPAPPQKKGKISSSAKLAEAWTKAWDDWDNVIAEASEDDGDYIIQEVRWEPPYLDTTRLTEDLEAIAERMLPLIPMAIEHQFSPDQGFVDALLESEAAIADGTRGSHYGAELYEGLTVEHQVTTCLLTWEWLTAQQQRQDAFQFIQQVREGEIQFSAIALDDDAMLEFFTELPEKDQQIIWQGWTTQKQFSMWREPLNNVRSYWRDFYLHLAQQHDPEQYLEQLCESIPQEWQSGLSVIEHYLENENYSKGLAIVKETVASLLGSQHVNKPWIPETDLLITLGFSTDYHRDSISRLLQYYLQTVQGLKQPKQVSVMELQCIAFDHWFDWSMMFDAFANSAVSAAVHKALFTSWQTHIAYRSHPRRHGYGGIDAVKPWWVPWLIESVVDKRKGATWFQQQLTQWLENLPNNPRDMGDDYKLLRLLTCDLMEIQVKRKSALPLFSQTVIRPKDLTSLDESSRRSYLQQAASSDLWDQVMRYWKAHFHAFVPEPERVHKSDYTEHARSLAALKELSPASYKALLAQWKVEHHRRINLWKAIAAAGLE
jgi:hypothetical protein